MVNILDILNIVFVLLQIALISIFYFQSKQLGRNSEIIIFGLVFGMLASFFSILDGISNYSRIFLSAQLIAFSIEFIILFIHFNYSVKEKVDASKISVLSLFFGILIVFSVKYMFGSLEGYDELLWDISYNVIGALSFLYISHILINSYKYSSEKEALIQGVGTSIMVIGFLIGIITTPIIREWVNLSLETYFADVIKAIGALLFISIFAFNADFVERISIDTYGILVFDNAGRELGFYNVRTKQKSKRKAIEIDPALFVPLISALLSFVKQALGTNKPMKSINGEDKTIVFEMGENIHTALIVEKSSLLLSKSMKIFRNKCEIIIMALSEEKRAMGMIDDREIKNSLVNTFPYIELLHSD